ncbi:hypothetical protein TNCV_95131 [Trichonephila clavipes]|nr:hypothetical protein TNCV_95131 [Trichonephila clavipes]
MNSETTSQWLVGHRELTPLESRDCNACIRMAEKPQWQYHEKLQRRQPRQSISIHRAVHTAAYGSEQPTLKSHPDNCDLDLNNLGHACFCSLIDTQLMHHFTYINTPSVIEPATDVFDV